MTTMTVLRAQTMGAAITARNGLPDKAKWPVR
jgi:hypothetical protein